MSFDDVGQGLDLALAEEGRLAVTLGRHAGDYMTSFYTHTPSGFMVEYGWGGKAIDPREIARTAGTLVHDAPDEKEKSASIKLTAYSRRGKATLKLDISTGASAYRIEGGADEFHGTGIACDLAEPFVVSGSGVTVRFTPSSDRAGTYEYQGSMSGFAVMGSGTYSVRYTGDTAASMSATGPGSVETPMGTMTKNGSEEYTLTPMTDSSCD